MLATAQDLEDQLVAFIAVLAEQHLQSLEGRRLQRLETVAGEDRADHREGSLPPIDLGGEKVARP